MTLYLLARSVDSMIKTLDSNNIIREPKYWEVVLYVAMVNFIAFQIVFAPPIAGRSNLAWFDKIAESKFNDKIYFDYLLRDRAINLYGNYLKV